MMKEYPGNEEERMRAVVGKVWADWQGSSDAHEESIGWAKEPSDLRLACLEAIPSALCSMSLPITWILRQ